MVAHALEDLYRRIADSQLDGLSEGEDPGSEPFVPVAHLSARREIVPTLLAPSPPATSTKIFEFFFPDWQEGLERWSSQEELLERAPRWLSLVRGLGGRTVEVVVKLCRIGAAHFSGLRKAKEAALGTRHNVKGKDENATMVQVR